MSKLSYAEQLKHPNWQRRRLQIMERDGFKCANCGDSESQLHVHHKQYRKGAMAWEYSDFELMTLCANCHEYASDVRARTMSILAELNIDGPAHESACADIIAGYAYIAIGGVDVTNEEFRGIGRQYILGMICAAIDELLFSQARDRGNTTEAVFRALRASVRFGDPGRTAKLIGKLLR